MFDGTLWEQKLQDSVTKIGKWTQLRKDDLALNLQNRWTDTVNLHRWDRDVTRRRMDEDMVDKKQRAGTSPGLHGQMYYVTFPIGSGDHSAWVVMFMECLIRDISHGSYEQSKKVRCAV